MRSILTCIMCIIITLSLTGCWDRKEVLDVAILMAATLDLGDKPGTYTSTVHLVDPKFLYSPGQPSQSKDRPIEKLIQVGRNVDENRISLEWILPRDLVPSHRRVFVIGESLAKHGIKDALDQLARNPKSRLNTYLVIAEGSRGEQLLDLPWTIESFGSEVFKEIIDRKMSVPTKIKDYYVASTTPGQQPVIASFSRNAQNRVQLSGVAIFNQNKLVGYVKKEEAALLVGMLGGKSMMSFTVSIPDTNENLSIQLTDLKLKPQVKLRNDKPEYTFNIKVNGKITDNRTNLDLSNPKNLVIINQCFSQYIEKHFESLFTKLQKDYQTDSIGLGAMVYRKNPKYWRRIEKDWPEIYPVVDVLLHVKGQVTEVGTIGAPLYLPSEEVQK